MLGIGRKAGYLTIGETGCIQIIKREKCKLLIVASDASENTKSRFISLCNRYNVKYVMFGNKEGLGHSLGKDFSAVVAISDTKFAEAIDKKMN